MNASSSNMKNKKKFLSPPKTDHFSYDNSQKFQTPVVPIGPRFQAELPTFLGPVYKKLDTSCWLGTKVWPVESINFSKVMPSNGNKVYEKKLNPIGKGRAETCSCKVPGSSECVKAHVAEEKIKLQVELGPTFSEWKLSEMGEGASRSWTAKEKQKFESILETDFSRRNDGFLRYTLKTLPNKKREAIISYYFNIIVPRQIEMKIKSGRKPMEITTDDEETEAASSIYRPRKRLKTKSQSTKIRYMTRVR